MRLSVIGCGYLGAVHAAAMAELGHQVIGVDVDERKVAELSAGRAPFFEPGLEDILKRGVDSGRLTFTTDMSAIADARIHFVGVGTPQKERGEGADLSYVDAAFDELAKHAAPGSLIAGKSTVPVGTAERLDQKLKTAGSRAVLAWNPEFLREGFAVQDTIAPDRLVYGLPPGDEAEIARAALDEVYAAILATGTPLVVADWATAELVKVAANAFLATKISFINAMAEVAEVAGADVTKLADAIGYDGRIGRRFLNAGVGFGGGCLPKDIRAFRARAEELGVGDSVAFLKEVDSINLRRRDRVVDIVREVLDGRLVGGRVAVLGLAFKPDSDDIRDSPALDIAVRLRGLGADVVCTDPEAIDNARRRHPQLRYEPDTMTALTGAGVVVLLTEWMEYRSVTPDRIAAVTDGRTIIDGRNVLDPAEWRTAGWTYIGLGRP